MDDINCHFLQHTQYYYMWNILSTIKDGDERAYSLHGLKHLLNPFGNGVNWQKQIWEDILKLHYGIINEGGFIQKYSNFYAISKLSVSSKDIMRRFKSFNNGRTYDK